MEYTSKLIVKELPEGGYSAIFAMNNIDKPLVISGQLGACDFLKYIEQSKSKNDDLHIIYSLDLMKIVTGKDG